MAMHSSWEVLARLQAVRLLRRRAAQNAQINAGGAVRHHVKGGLAALRAAGVRFVNITPTGDDLDYRWRGRMAADPAQHRHRADAGAVPRAAGRRPARQSLPRSLHRGLREARALSRRQDAAVGREDHRHPGVAHRGPGARDGGHPHNGQHQLGAAAQPSRRAAVLGTGDARLHAGPDRPAGRRLRCGLRADQPDGRRRLLRRPCRRATTR